MLSKILIGALIAFIAFYILTQPGAFFDIIDTVVTGTDQGTAVGKTALENLLPAIILGVAVLGGFYLWIKSKSGGG